MLLSPKSKEKISSQVGLVLVPPVPIPLGGSRLMPNILLIILQTFTPTIIR